MDELKNNIKEQIFQLKEEIFTLTEKIELFRQESSEEDISMRVELEDKHSLLIEKLKRLEENLMTYINQIHTNNVILGKEINVSIGSIKRGFTIVLPDDADPAKGYVSSNSPLGVALLGKQEGQVAMYETPGGIMKMKINRVG